MGAAAPRIAVMDVKVRGGVSGEVASTVSEAVVVEVRRRSPGASVIGAEEIRSMIGVAVEKAKLGCDDMACLAEIGGALGAERLVLGTLGRLGDTYLLSLQLVDVAHGRVVASGAATVSAKHDDLLFGAVASAVGQIFGTSTATPPAPPRQVSPSLREQLDLPPTRCPVGRLFGDEQAYGTGGMPTGLGVADFDGDGRQDLVVASYREGKLQLFLNRGEGLFRPPRSFALPKGAAPESLAVADFDRDGHPDVAVTTAGEDRVDVLLGDGKGGFGPPRSFRLSGPSEYALPRGLVAADLDGDGKIDLAAVDSNGGSGAATVLYGDGRGGFGAGVHVVAAEDESHVYGLAAGDLDGDGRADLVVLQDPGTANVVLSQKGRRFAAPVPLPTGRQPRAAALADLDGDGKLDLVVGNCGDDSVSVLRGFGDGTFAPPRSFATTLAGVGRCPLAVVAADFDGDGRPDLAVADGAVLSTDDQGRPEKYDRTVTLLLARDGGRFEAVRTLQVGRGQPAYLAAGHFQGKGGPADLAVSFWGPYNFDGPSAVSVFLAGCR